MPFAPHYRVTALGRLGAGADIFSYGLNMAPDNGNGSASGLQNIITLNDTAWDDLAEDVRAFHGRAGTRISERAVLEVVKIARIGSDGKYMEDPRIVNVTDTPGGYTVDSDCALVHPQLALAVSLVTDRRGPSGKGRFYVPMPVVSSEADSLLGVTADIDSIATSAQTLINDMNNSPGIDVTTLKVCVSSTKGYNTGVERIRVGRAVDTIRTRRNKLAETYRPSLDVS